MLYDHTFRFRTNWACSIMLVWKCRTLPLFGTHGNPDRNKTQITNESTRPGGTRVELMEPNTVEDEAAHRRPLWRLHDSVQRLRSFAHSQRLLSSAYPD